MVEAILCKEKNNHAANRMTYKFIEVQSLLVYSYIITLGMAFRKLPYYGSFFIEKYGSFSK
jgi:hypothetical protein